MSWTLPRLLRRLGASLVHTQYAVPWRCPCPAVVTIHDLSFERDPTLMGKKDLAVFKRVVPRAARRGGARAHRLRAVEARSRGALRAAGRPRRRHAERRRPCLLARRQRRSSARLPALGRRDRAAQEPACGACGGAARWGCRSSIAGPANDQALAVELRRAGARVEGYVETERLVDLYRGAACLIQASLHEGFGLPVLEAMACGTPVVTVPEPALVEVVGDAAVVVAEEDLGRRGAAGAGPARPALLRGARAGTRVLVGGMR